MSEHPGSFFSVLRIEGLIDAGEMRFISQAENVIQL